MTDTQAIVIGFIVFAVVWVLMFLLLREFNCWYFKVNKRVKQMDELIANQRRMIELLQDMKSSAPAAPKAPQPAPAGPAKKPQAPASAPEPAAPEVSSPGSKSINEIYRNRFAK